MPLFVSYDTGQWLTSLLCMIYYPIGWMKRRNRSPSDSIFLDASDAVCVRLRGSLSLLGIRVGGPGCGLLFGELKLTTRGVSHCGRGWGNKGCWDTSFQIRKGAWTIESVGQQPCCLFHSKSNIMFCWSSRSAQKTCSLQMESPHCLPKTSARPLRCSCIHTHMYDSKVLKIWSPGPNKHKHTTTQKVTQYDRYTGVSIRLTEPS